MTDQHDSAEQLANVSADLTALADARARVRIDAAERDTDTVGFVLGRYRAQAGLTERELADLARDRLAGARRPGGRGPTGETTAPRRSRRRWASTSSPSCTAWTGRGCTRRSTGPIRNSRRRSDDRQGRRRKV